MSETTPTITEAIIAIVTKALNTDKADKNGIIALKLELLHLKDQIATDLHEAFTNLLNQAVAVPAPEAVDQNRVAAVQIPAHMLPVAPEAAEPEPPNALQQKALDEQVKDAGSSPQSAIDEAFARKLAAQEAADADEAQTDKVTQDDETHTTAPEEPAPEAAPEQEQPTE